MMKQLKNSFVIFTLIVLFSTGGSYDAAFADHDDDRDRRRHEKEESTYDKHNGKRDVAPVSNAEYAENCGACHFAYQPGLLPSGAWDNILKGLADHFGEAVELDKRSMNVVGDYLKTHAADHSSAKLSGKIMKSIGSQTPLRITQVPYIQKKHHEIEPGVFERESIGSFSNCAACHTSAQEGIYDDDAVRIPN